MSRKHFLGLILIKRQGARSGWILDGNYLVKIKRGPTHRVFFINEVILTNLTLSGNDQKESQGTFVKS